MKYGGTVVFSQRDEFGFVEVIENSSVRKLHFGNIIEQSSMFRNAPMTLKFEYQQAIVDLVQNYAEKRSSQKPFRVLMLGLGGGSMALKLHHSLPDMQMTIVELRQLVIDVAYKFFHLPDDPSIDTVQADALAFVNDLAQNFTAGGETLETFAYDSIIVDIYNSKGIPIEFSEAPFNQALAKCVKPKGQIIFNLWNRYSPQQKLEPTPETADILEFWRAQEHFTMQHHLVKTSTNLILELTRTE